MKRQMPVLLRWKAPRFLRVKGLTDRILHKVSIQNEICQGAFFEKIQRSLTVYQCKLTERYLPPIEKTMHYCQTLRAQCPDPPQTTAQARKLRECQNLETEVHSTLYRLQSCLDEAYAQANTASAIYSKAAFFRVLRAESIPRFVCDTPLLAPTEKGEDAL